MRFFSIRKPGACCSALFLDFLPDSSWYCSNAAIFPSLAGRDLWKSWSLRAEQWWQRNEFPLISLTQKCQSAFKSHSNLWLEAHGSYLRLPVWWGNKIFFQMCRNCLICFSLSGFYDFFNGAEWLSGSERGSRHIHVWTRKVNKKPVIFSQIYIEYYCFITLIMKWISLSYFAFIPLKISGNRQFREWKVRWYPLKVMPLIKTIIFVVVTTSFWKHVGLWIQLHSDSFFFLFVTGWFSVQNLSQKIGIVQFCFNLVSVQFTTVRYTQENS